MPYDIRVENLEPVPLASIRAHAPDGDFSKAVPEACGAVWRLVKENGVQGAGRLVAIYAHGPNAVEVGVELPAALEPVGGLSASSTPSGPAIRVTHLGPYQQLSLAHQAIRDWATANNRTLGTNWEVYGHWLPESDNDPSQIRTDVYYTLA